MDKIKPGSHRDRMRDDCAGLMALLSKYDRISMSDIADSIGMKHHTLRRWLNSFSAIMDLRIEKGIVIIERH